MSSERSNALAELIYPVELWAFIEEYWDKRPLYVSGGIDRSRGLDVSLDSFLATVRNASPGPRTPVKAQYFDSAGRHQERELEHAGLGLVPDLLNSGMTICVSNYDRLSPSVELLARRLAASIGLPGSLDVACYVSGPGRGFGLHFDDTAILVLQCEGTKRWLFSHERIEPSATLLGGVLASEHSEVVAFLRRNPGVPLAIPLERDLEERVLHQNDLLFLPAGTWHRTYAEDVSVALTFSLSSRRLDKALAQSVANAMLARPPIAAIPDNSPPDLATWVTSRVPAMVQAAQQLSATQLVERVAAIVGEEMERESNATIPKKVAALPQEAGADTEFRVAEAVAFIAPNEAGDLRTYVYVGDDGLQLPLACSQLARRITQATSCTADNLRVWAGDSVEDISVVTRSLVDIGLLIQQR